MFAIMRRSSKFNDARLDGLYTADDFGGERTMRARVIRELIDEIRDLRRAAAAATDPKSGGNERSSDPR